MINEWVQKSFGETTLSPEILFNQVRSFFESEETRKVSVEPLFHYELAKVHTEAAFMLYQMHCNSKDPFMMKNFSGLEERMASDDEELVKRAAIIAGIKWKAFQMVRNYTEQRIQGGKVIKEWSSLKMHLSELYLVCETEKSLIETLNPITALSIIKNSDTFISGAMQVMGGAGYMEDYEVERLFRECTFLKNWPQAFQETLYQYCESKDWQ